jgi:hypothetical protein
MSEQDCSLAKQMMGTYEGPVNLPPEPLCRELSGRLAPAAVIPGRAQMAQQQFVAAAAQQAPPLTGIPTSPQPAPFIPGLAQQARAMQGVPCWYPIKAGDAVPDGVSTVLIEAADYAAYRTEHQRLAQRLVELLAANERVKAADPKARADTRTDAFPARALRGGDGVFLG